MIFWLHKDENHSLLIVPNNFSKLNEILQLWSFPWNTTGITNETEAA